MPGGVRVWRGLGGAVGRGNARRLSTCPRCQFHTATSSHLRRPCSRPLSQLASPPPPCSLSCPARGQSKLQCCHSSPRRIYPLASPTAIASLLVLPPLLPTPFALLAPSAQFQFPTLNRHPRHGFNRALACVCNRLHTHYRAFNCLLRVGHLPLPRLHCLLTSAAF